MLLSDSAPPPSWHVERLPATELPVLVLSQELATFLPDQRRRAGSEQRRAPHAAATRAGSAPGVPASARLVRAVTRRGSTATQLGPASLWRNEHRTFLLSFVDADVGGTRQRYFLPLTLAWEDGHDTGALRTAEWTLAKVREHARVGVLIDAFADPVVLPRSRALHGRECDRAVRRRRAAFRVDRRGAGARRRCAASRSIMSAPTRPTPA